MRIWHRICTLSVALFIVSGFLVPSGCGPSKGTVSGTVNFKGAPLPSGSIVIIVGKDAFPGVIEKDGKYKIIGVALGAAKITVTTSAGGTTSDPAGGKDIAPPMIKGKEAEAVKGIPIPQRYGDPDQSGLTLTVKAGANQFNIDLQP